MSTSSTSTSSPPPIPFTRLSELTNEILTTIFPPTTTTPLTYNHALTSSQNTTIINTLLQKLISETSSSSSSPTSSGEPDYKFLVQSTIIQQGVGTGEREGGGKRGMHSASGAYWNNERDGMWSFKWEGEGEGKGSEEGRGFDVVVSVVWISVV